MTESWFERAAGHLEWERFLPALLGRCRGISARRRGLCIAATRAEAAGLLRETDELMALLERGEHLPLGDLRDVEAHLARLQRQGALKVDALFDLLVMLRGARALRDFLSAQRKQAPALFAACTIDPALDALLELLNDAIDPDGTLSDRASPELKALRTEVSNLRTRIIGRLEYLIERYADVLSDQFFTLREGRYVLPVRRDAHERVAGIVHATSDSGASIFVEPRAIVEQGNRLKIAESELEREQERVLAELSERVCEYLPSLIATAEAIDRIDLRNAGALLGREFGFTVPELNDEGMIRLPAARHPLLLLDGIDAVPNDIELSSSRALVISGPNASGKTVLLKTLGLCALLVRHGLPIPASRGSHIPFFESVLTDVGDEQSTAQNLSTFSAHIRNVAAILAAAGPGSLVLLDELATGTDPEEGAALACAIVDAIATSGALLVVTTHYEPLKAYSLHDPRLRSASVGFDVDRMEPTFLLTLDVPGASSALLVAKRFGIPEHVLDFARRVLPDQARNFETLVRELHARVHALQDERLEVAREHAALSTLRAVEQTRLEKQKRVGDSRIEREIAEVLAQIKLARAELERARAELRVDGASKQELAAAQKRIDTVAGRVALGGDLAQPPPLSGARRTEGDALEDSMLRPGSVVHVTHLRSDAIVIEGPNKGRVRVTVGALKLWVERSGLVPSQASPSPTPAVIRAQHTQSPERTSDNTLSLKGMRVDDALSMMESFIDRLSMTDMRVGYVVHGHGSGALREAVRQHLKSNLPQVRESRAAHVDEGGEAVTVFFLA